jgi:outer membrane cobalamin receptor
MEEDSRNAPWELIELPAFTTLDLRISQRLFEDHLEVYAGVDNVADVNPELNLGFPLAGRTVILGGSVTF